MPRLGNVVVGHRLSQDEAVKRTMQLLTEIQSASPHEVTIQHETWNGNRGEFTAVFAGFSANCSHYSVSGVITVTDHNVELFASISVAAIQDSHAVRLVFLRHMTRLLV